MQEGTPLQSRQVNRELLVSILNSPKWFWIALGTLGFIVLTSKVLLGVTLLWVYHLFAFFITFWYGRLEVEQNIIKYLIVDTYGAVFLVNLVFSFAAPFAVLIWNPVRRSAWGPALAGILIIIGGLAFNIRIFVGAANAAVGTEFLQGLGDTRYHHVASDGIGRGYHIYVMLPDGYDESADDRYPTIYLLDGGALFPLLSAYYRYLTLGEEIPNAIIVGISYGSDNLDGGNYRSTDYTAKSPERDYWGGAGQFQKFLSEELLPFIEGSYPSRSDRRVIFGQSIGGQFVLYTALTKPNLFWGT